MAFMCLMKDSLAVCYLKAAALIKIKHFILLLSRLFPRQLQRATAEENPLQDPKLPEPVCRRWSAHPVHCKKGEKSALCEPVKT